MAFRVVVVLAALGACRSGFDPFAPDDPREEAGPLDVSLVEDAAPLDDDAPVIDGPIADAPMIDAALGDGGMPDAPMACGAPAMVCADVQLGSALGSPVRMGTTFGEPDQFTSMCGGGGEPDVALQWEAPEAGRYVISTRGSGIDTVLSVRDSCAGPVVRCNDDNTVTGSYSELTLDVAACQAMLLVVDGVTSAGSYALDIRKKCPGVDTMSNVGVLASGSTTDHGDSYEAAGCGGAGEHDVAHTWTVPSTGRYVIDTRGSGLDTVLSLRSSCTSAPIACNDDDPTGGSTSVLSLDLVEGQQYVLVVDGLTSSGAYTLRANRKCPGTSLGMMLGDGLATGSTFQQGDSYTSSCGGGGEGDVTLMWTAPADGRYVFDTRGSGLDTVLSARTSCTAAPLACNDDAATGGSQSALIMDVTAGTSLVFVVDGKISEGTYRFNAHRKCPGIDLGSALGTAVATGSTTDQGDGYTTTCGGAGEHDVAFRWVAPATGRFTFTTQGSGFDTVLSARTSCTSAPLACNDDNPVSGSWSQLALDLVMGQEIQLVLDGAISSGAYQLNIQPG